MTLRRAGAVLLLLAGATVFLIERRDTQQREHRDDVAAARRELSVSRLAPPGSAPQAGISARVDIDVPAFPERLARRLHDAPDFHRLSHRCGVCHSTPDPSLHTPADWPAVIARMSRTIDAAGLLPLSPADSAAVLRALTRNYQD